MVAPFRIFMASLIILNYMDKQIKSTICATLNCNIQTVWKVVTSLNDYSWRSDIVSISFSDKRHFTERNSDDIITHFIVRVFEPYSQYSFDLDNKTYMVRGLDISSKLIQKLKLNL